MPQACRSAAAWVQLGQMGIRSLARRLQRVFQLGETIGRTLRLRRHAMRFGGLHEVVVGNDGGLASTGYFPRVDLISNQADLPRRWCWVRLDVGDGGHSPLPHLLVQGTGSSEPERHFLAPPTPDLGPSLLRLPEHVSRIELVPGNRPGPANLRAVRITEVGKIRLLLSLVRNRPRAAWRIYRTRPSFAHFKTKLIEDAQQRPHSARALDWLRIYESGVHPLAIPCSGESSFTILLRRADAEADRLREAIASVLAQSYADWRLIIIGSDDAAGTAVVREAMTSSAKIRNLDADARIPSQSLGAGGSVVGDTSYVVFMNADECLEPHALARFADAAARDNADMIYADKVSVGRNGAGYAALDALPVFSHAAYLRCPARIHPVALRATLALRADGSRQPADHMELDVILRALEHDLRVTHLPDILSRTRVSRLPARRNASDVDVAAALETAHLRRMGFDEAKVSPANLVDTFTVRHHSRPKGRVLAVVPTKDGYSLLNTCISTVQATTRELDIDIAVVDHESADQQTLSYLAALASQGVRILPYKGGFNFSALNNAAVSELGGGYDYHLFLNNDIEAVEEGWLEAMLDLAMQPDVGVVGATLLYPDRRIQHAGVVVGMVGPAEHAYRFARLEDYRDLRSGPHLTREYSAVTGACMLVKSSAFRAAGGFDPELEVGLNDIDLCLRLREIGYRVLNCAEAILIHHESASRGKSDDGRDPHPEDTRWFMARHARILQAGDPFFSPLLDRHDPLFSPKPNTVRERDIRPRTIEYVPATYDRTAVS